jgi:hypothetical protein
MVWGAETDAVCFSAHRSKPGFTKQVLRLEQELLQRRASVDVSTWRDLAREWSNCAFGQRDQDLSGECHTRVERGGSGGRAGAAWIWLFRWLAMPGWWLLSERMASDEVR